MKKLSSAQIQTTMGALGAAPMLRMVADRAYALPTSGWVRNEFGPALRTLLGEMFLADWTEESHDCDDFARLAAAYAQMLHYRTAAGSKCGLAVGEFWFMQRSGGGHAINVAITSDARSGDGVLFFEPQTSKELDLTPAEIKSCMGYRF